MYVCICNAIREKDLRAAARCCRDGAEDLYARYGRLELMGFVLLGCGLMLAWSKPWLARFRFGPLEWLWRSLTYAKLAPMRRPLAIESDSQ